LRDWKDKTKSMKYCHLCYEDGEFKDDFKKPEQMVEFVKDIFKKEGAGPLKCWFFTSNIKRLERWQ